MHDPMQEPDIEQGVGPEVGAEPTMGAELPNGELDREGAMAKADLYKLANYSQKLFKKINDEDQLEGWVQAKITKAADYIASVYHYLEYEMQFSEYGEKIENSEMYTEDQKIAMKQLLAEAKSKIKNLKKEQADKIVGKKKVDEEKSSTGGEITRGKGFTRHTHNPDRFSDEPHGEESSKAKSKSASEKAGDKAADKAEEKEGKNWEKRFGKGSVTRVKDGKKVDEAFDEKSKTGDTFKTRTGVATKTSTGVKHTNTSHSDEEHGEPASKVKSRSAAEKAGDKAADKAAEKESKAYEKKHPGTVKRYKDGKLVKEAAKSPKAKKDYDKDGKVESEKDEVIGSRRKAAGLDEAAKPDFLDMDKDGNKKEPMKKAIKDKKVKEGATGGYSAKDAAAGKDLGKPGKNFEKIAKAAKGRGGKKVAGAVLANLRKESVDPSKANILEAIAKAKARMEEGSIQGGVWVSTPDKGVPPPSNDDQGTLAPAKKPAAKKPTAPAKPGVKKAEGEPATDTAVAERMDESVERIKALTSRLLG